MVPNGYKTALCDQIRVIGNELAICCWDQYFQTESPKANGTKTVLYIYLLSICATVTKVNRHFVKICAS